MLSDAIRGNVETMVRPVRTRFFDPRTGEPCTVKGRRAAFAEDWA